MEKNIIKVLSKEITKNDKKMKLQKRFVKKKKKGSMNSTLQLVSISDKKKNILKEVSINLKSVNTRKRKNSVKSSCRKKKFGLRKIDHAKSRKGFFAEIDEYLTKLNLLKDLFQVEESKLLLECN